MYCFQDISLKEQNLKKKQEKGQLLLQPLLDLLQNFRAGRSLCADHYYPNRILISITIFELFAKNYNLPYVLFLAMAAMFFYESKIRTIVLYT